MMSLLQKFLLFVGVVVVLGSPQLIHATENDGYSITITKYELSDLAEIENQLPIDGTRAESIISPDGKTLETLYGITYEIVRVSPVEGTTDFKPVQGMDAFYTEITTDENGIAQVSNLAAGTYRVTEISNEVLNGVMKPVILELPLPQRNGEALKDVFLYPKSGVVTPTVPDTPIPGTASPSGRIPQTSGNIGNLLPVYLTLIAIVILGLIGVYSFRPRKNKR